MGLYNCKVPFAPSFFADVTAESFEKAAQGAYLEFVRHYNQVPLSVMDIPKLVYATLSATNETKIFLVGIKVEAAV